MYTRVLFRNIYRLCQCEHVMCDDKETFSVLIFTSALAGGKTTFISLENFMYQEADGISTYLYTTVHAYVGKQLIPCKQLITIV